MAPQVVTVQKDGGRDRPEHRAGRLEVRHEHAHEVVPARIARVLEHRHGLGAQCALITLIYSNRSYFFLT